MKPLAILLSLSFAGCATYIPLTQRELCAQKGLMEGADGRCVSAQSAADKCEVQRTQKVIDPKLKHNDIVGGYRVVGGIGYVLLIIPGIVIYKFAENRKDMSVKQSNILEEQTPRTCGPSGKSTPSS